MRDLLTVLEIDKVTVVGHSFGGGVAMQFAYQFPERTERMVLVGSGGLGPEVSAAIRAITTTGFHQVMGALTLPGVRQVGTAGLRALSRTGLKEFRDFDEVAEIYESFRDPAARAAIRHVVRAVVDWQGQIVTMADRAYLTEAMPMLRRLGRPGPGDPGQPRRPRRRAGAQGADRDRSRTPATSPTRTTPSGSCGSSTTSSAPPAPRRTPAPAGAGSSSRVPPPRRRSPRSSRPAPDGIPDTSSSCPRW